MILNSNFMPPGLSLEDIKFYTCPSVQTSVPHWVDCSWKQGHQCPMERTHSSIFSVNSCDFEWQLFLDIFCDFGERWVLVIFCDFGEHFLSWYFLWFWRTIGSCYFVWFELFTLDGNIRIEVIVLLILAEDDWLLLTMMAVIPHYINSNKYKIFSPAYINQNSYNIFVFY